MTSRRQLKRKKADITKFSVMRDTFVKAANGDDDEEGRRELNDKDRSAIAAFMKKRPKGQKDEKFHAFVEAKGINPHGAEEHVYDMLGAKLSHAFAKLAIGAPLGEPPMPPPSMKGYKPPKPAGDTPQQRLKKSQDIGAVTAFDQKTQGIKMQKYEPISMMKQNAAKLGFTVSQYSGPLSMGRFSYRSPWGMPGNPQGMKTAGPPPGEEEEMNGDKTKEKTSAIARAARNAIEAMGEWQQKQAAPTTPQGRLTKSMQVGAPKVTAPPGPSIAQLSKPMGYGKPLPGATKGPI